MGRNNVVKSMKYEHNTDELIAAGWTPGAKRPADGAFVAYLFEPFSAVFVGYYEQETDSICGRSGFSSWNPEVLCWYPLPEKKATFDAVKSEH